MGKFKQLIKNMRVIILLIFLIFSLYAISPTFGDDALAIRSVLRNSSAENAGLQSPNPNSPPMLRERIIAINNKAITTEEEFYSFINTLKVNQSFTLLTNKVSRPYRIIVKPLIETIELNETELITKEETITINQTINGTIVEVETKVNKTVEVPKVITNVIGIEDIGLSVYPAPKNNIRKGLDLQGGTRVLLEPEEKLNPDVLAGLLDNMKQRLNIYGLSDVIVREAGDLAGSQFIVVEIAGVNEEEIRELLAKQGKFEAKIGETTVFKGGSDITYVCRSAECSGIDPQAGCGAVSGGTACRYRFSIALTQEAAQRQADATENLDIVAIDQNGNPIPRNQQYLAEQIRFILDDTEVNALNIAADLRGNAATEIVISGTGLGPDLQSASIDAIQNMNRMQTILITGSLPVRLDVVKTDSISSSLGKEFVDNAILVGIIAILVVTSIIYIRFRKLRIAVPMFVTMVSEIILLLGLAAVSNWNLDLAAIAGIIIAVGTGVDHQIVITDELLRKEEQVFSNWKQRIKSAFSIIMASYVTTIVALIPLMFAGAGLLRGFALTTMAGVTFGVFITRPAYAAIIEILLKE